MAVQEGEPCDFTGDSFNLNGVTQSRPGDSHIRQILPAAVSYHVSPTLFSTTAPSNGSGFVYKSDGIDCCYWPQFLLVAPGLVKVQGSGRRASTQCVHLTESLIMELFTK